MSDILKKRPHNGPSAHALVIGVSHYRHFEGGSAPTSQGRAWQMSQLTSAAASACAIADWLIRDYNSSAPLQTLQLLVSPQESERLPSKLAGAVRRPSHRATRANVEKALRDFRKACDSHVDNVGIVYLAGHGVQLSKHDAILLLEDAGAASHLNALHGAIDAVGCHRGMNHAATASTQLWFVDACRQRPEVAELFETMTGALTLDEKRGVTKSSPLFLASSPREAAFARRGGRTLFCEAILAAMNGGAAVGPSTATPRWHVSTLSLNERLSNHVRALAQLEGERQTIDPGGRMTPAIVHEFSAPPPVELHVALEPQAAASVSCATILLDGRAPVLGVPRGFPFQMSLNAGLYLLSVRTRAPFRDASNILNLVPPMVAHAVDVTP